MKFESDVILNLDKVGISFPKSKRFSLGKFWALKQVSLELRKGETLGILGRNGAGKSTLLKLLSGILTPDRGRFYRRPGIRISLLALQLGFIPELTGRENAILSCILLGLRRKQALGVIREIFEFAEIEDFIDEPIATYSSGMKARLGFGVAMVANPDVLLVDEVLGVGDMPFQTKSRKLMCDRIRSDESVVIVSHDIKTIAELCNRAVFIDDGRTVIQGETGIVIERYKEFTREATAI